MRIDDNFKGHKNWESTQIKLRQNISFSQIAKFWCRKYECFTEGNEHFSMYHLQIEILLYSHF